MKKYKHFTIIVAILVIIAILNDAKEAGIDLETSVKYINDVLRYTCQYEYNDMTENVLKSIDN